MESEDFASFSSEVRYIVLELMKLAASKGTTFDDELEEYFENAYKLHAIIVSETSQPVIQIKGQKLPDVTKQKRS